MPTIALAIQKGGSGKTTTVINLAAALQQQNNKVLVVDMDPQANCTQALGILEEQELGIYQLLKKEASGEEINAKNAILVTKAGVDLIPSGLELASAEMELVSVYGREQLTRQLLKPLKGVYDYIFIDCPPAIGMLTVNALVASDYVLMPLQAEFLPLRGVKSFLRAFSKIKKHIHPQLKLLGFILTKFDRRKSMNRSVLEQLEQEFGSKVFQTHVRTNIALAKAQEAGLDIFHFDKNSNGALDYCQLAQELLECISHER
ncbi:ParA family protein [Negadavirga shengliensis]|uniref:ParA family protein n=1 Tax=Negadavirga shengliensis TaxID=1389218 RepID=A0ABV9T621_9BACT